MNGQDQPPQSGSTHSPPPRNPYQTQDSLPLPDRDGKPVSFYLAIFLALLLFVSGGLNLLLLFVTAVGSATSGLAGYTDESDGIYEMVAVAGEADATERILRVPIIGAIAETQSPVIGAIGGTVSQVRRALRAAAREDSIKGILFDINSPGGGVTDSDEIHRLITEFRAEHEKPVVALFGDVSASGGYYMAVACDQIIARPTTITGSIGVIMQNFNFAEAAKRLGIKQETIVSDSTPFKDIMSFTREMRPEEREILTSIVDEMYAQFVRVVDEGRPALDRARVEQLADGRIYSAQQALDNGLIDSIGSIEDAYDVLNELCSIDKSRVVEQRRRPTLGDLLMGANARPPSLEHTAATLLTQPSGPRLYYYWAGAR